MLREKVNVGKSPRLLLNEINVGQEVAPFFAECDENADWRLYVALLGMVSERLSEGLTRFPSCRLIGADPL